jgi:glycosyltransferase involved in cell wall biosynthesis
MPEELPIPSGETDEVVVMFAGRFDRVRGVDPFLDVAPDVLANREDVVCWISGYGPDEEIERVRGRVEEIDADRIEFFGTLPWEEYRQRIVDANVLVNFQDPDAPISRYTFPSKLLDFLSATTPVVSTDMSDLAEHFDDKLFIAGTQHNELVRGVERVAELTEEEQVPSIAENGCEWVEEECTHEAVGGKLFALIGRAN